MRPYRIMKCLQIDDLDMQRRVTMCNRMIEILTQHPEWLWMWSDEARFENEGAVATNTFVRYRYVFF